jgi:hypothetical protein
MVIFPAWTADTQTALSSVYVSTPQMALDKGRVGLAGHVKAKTVPIGQVWMGMAVDVQLEK